MSRHYGIIGNPLEHSFSAKYFTEKFRLENIDADYHLYSLESLDELSKVEQLDGYNVTYPYKESIIPKLNEIDSIAQHIGAVNVVCRGKGYNTDYIGFAQSIRPLLLPSDQHALILGTGGAAKAVRYALEEMNIAADFVSRDKNKGILYDQLTPECMAAHTLIINCTPMGMYPDIQCPQIPYTLLTRQHLLYDCIYNPQQTRFLALGAQYGARTKNGLDMLFAQAEAAWAIWNTQQENIQ